MIGDNTPGGPIGTKIKNTGGKKDTPNPSALPSARSCDEVEH
jgi:hypothetical protein